MVESLTDFPPNILVEILVRLPLKTLFASRCVCKTFLNLATPNPHFIALHSSNATQTLVFQFGDVFKPSKLLRSVEPELVISPGFVEKFRSIPIFQMPKMGSNIIHYRSNFREENKFVLVNSCNGLLYFVRRHAPDELSLVCNPVTNEYLMIPDVDHESSLRSRTVGAQVLVVGSSSWRDIEVTLLGSDHSWDACSAFLNGVIYWLIVFFDFEREVFGDIALPPELGEEQEK